MSSVSTEIEATFPGGEGELGAIVEWLCTLGGFKVGSARTVHRVHLYFDDGSRLRDAGCRLRCIVAPGEWVRYDFKADDPAGGRETVELSRKVAAPESLSDVVADFMEQLPEGPWREALEKGSSVGFRVFFAMTGTHVKAIARRANLELEISWDRLSAVESGKLLSEIEVELLSGSRDDYEDCIGKMQRDLDLRSEIRNKLDRMSGR